MGDGAIAAGCGSSLIFVTLNVAMNLYMKWLFAPTGGDFPFPWTMLAVQQLQAYMVLQPWIALKYPVRRWGWDLGDDRGEGLGWSSMLQVLAVTVLFCLNVGLNSLSLVRISITLNQTVRAFLPVGVLVLATCLEQRTYPRHSYVTTGMLILGIALTCWGSPDFEFLGFCMALASTIVAAVGSSINGRLLSGPSFNKAGPEKIALLMMFQSVPAFLAFSAVALLTEATELRAALAADGRWQWYQRLGLVSISSALALMSNLARCFLVAATSALMETFAGNAKVAALCIIDNMLFHTVLLPYNYAGIGLTFTGFSVHVLLQYASRSDPEPEPEKKLVISPTNGTFHGLVPQQPQRVLALERLISGAETGLCSEHVALRLGKPSRRRKREEPELERQRASTWQAGVDPTRTWLERVGAGIGMDLAPVIEPPPWLLREESADGTPVSRGEPDWPPLSCSTPRSPVGGGDYDPMVLLPSRASRSRIWSDMTHSAVGNPRPA